MSEVQSRDKAQTTNTGDAINASVTNKKTRTNSKRGSDWGVFNFYERRLTLFPNRRGRAWALARAESTTRRLTHSQNKNSDAKRGKSENTDDPTKTGDKTRWGNTTEQAQP
jgi:hypothetical protein